MVSLVVPVQTVTADDKKPEATAYSVAVTGVTCNGCLPSARTALLKVKGAEKVEFDAVTKVATVTMKSGKSATKEDAEAVFKGTKFGVASFTEKGEEKEKKSS